METGHRYQCKSTGNKIEICPRGTTVIVGDSIINDIIELTLNRKFRIANVSNFPGATVADLEHYLIPIIHK